ncbi:hypothetical protein [Breznakiella homolactica]|uniref:Flagellar protein FlgN n=1 Tax=Breznakiella homolactica TaxID=2798577 RepID=A0A7T8B8P3_9SPIR|nr:hypothetical protein [Breznakiella homolactica]QQO07521.1 hypothetical protein JFL75_11225 [Breznakiella homolactica]
MNTSQGKTRHGHSGEDFDNCMLILSQEVTVLENLSACQDLVRKAVMNREWVDFDGKISSLNDLSDQFEALEFERTRLFARYSQAGDGIAEEEGFYAMALRLPLGQRHAMTSLYRQLKMYILRIRLANDSLMHYINEAKLTVSEFLEAAFPDRKGRLYSRRGTQIPSDMRSMVLNRSL